MKINLSIFALGLVLGALAWGVGPRIGPAPHQITFGSIKGLQRQLGCTKIDGKFGYAGSESRTKLEEWEQNKNWQKTQEMGKLYDQEPLRMIEIKN